MKSVRQERLNSLKATAKTLNILLPSNIDTKSRKIEDEATSLKYSKAPDYQDQISTIERGKPLALTQSIGGDESMVYLQPKRSPKSKISSRTSTQSYFTYDVVSQDSDFLWYDIALHQLSDTGKSANIESKGLAKSNLEPRSKKQSGDSSVIPNASKDTPKYSRRSCHSFLYYYPSDLQLDWSYHLAGIGTQFNDYPNTLNITYRHIEGLNGRQDHSHP